MLFDFHTHTFLSDGALLPVELIRRAAVRGYTAIGIADHVSLSNVDEVVAALVKDCALAERCWGIMAIPGAELTHVPADAIAEVARAAKNAGAKYVVVHGETIAEPVEPGTNAAAVRCPQVDILAHPGLITLDEARQAAANGIYLEITSKAGHSLTNGHVATVGRLAGVRFLLNTDTHEPDDLYTEEKQIKVGLGAGLREEELEVVRFNNPKRLLTKLGRKVG
jgi:histidinol phosphatase-like PHP family hydrolase